jgi:hypothetical protein
MYPFIFYKSSVLDGAHSDAWYVLVGGFDYTYQKTGLPHRSRQANVTAVVKANSNIEVIGDECLVPTINVEQCKETHCFCSEEEALEFVRTWWQKQ